MTLSSKLRTWIEIDKIAIKHNFDTLKSLTNSSCKFCAVVKSNAYGHNFMDFSMEMEKLGADWFAVDSVTEGLRLRKEGIKKPILVLGYTVPDLLDEAVENDLSLTVSSFDALEKAVEASAKIHIKVDTGMHRQGFLVDQIDQLLDRLSEHAQRVEGLYTHFASTKDPKEDNYTKKQIGSFLDCKKKFLARSINPIVHATATATIITHKEAHFDMVRAGIGLYGLFPSLDIKEYAEKNGIYLKPIMSWKSIVSEVKNVPAGEGVSYNLTNILKKDSVLAVVPIGYWHGFPFALSNRGHVFVGKTKCPVLGRVTMDMIVIDVSHVSGIKIGDEVTLIGEEVNAYDFASLSNTSWYEVLTRINPLIKKIYK